MQSVLSRARTAFFRCCHRPLVQTTLLVAALLCVSPVALTQTATTGVLSGTVTDPSGAGVPNALVQVMNHGTGEKREVKSGPNGTYVAPLLSPGAYRVEVGAEGFARVAYPNIRIAVTETTVLDVGLKVGAASVTVEVSGAPPVVQTTTNTLGDVVSTNDVQSLPLVNRNFTQIMDLSAGVAAGVTRADEIGRGSGGEIPVAEGAGLYVQGARASDNNFQMNGVNINDFGGYGLGIAIPNPDTIQEFKVQTGMYDAEYGRNAGANVDLVTRTGTNDFHGNLFEFWRNDALNANDFFVKQSGSPRPELKQNQFGGTLGGPIIKNKFLFFGSYQGTRQANAVYGRQEFVSPELTDDRSAATIGTLFAGQQGLCYIFCPGLPGFGPAIAADGSNIDSAALALLQLKLPNGSYLFPTPNPATCSDPMTCLVSLTVPAIFHENQYMGNFEYLQSSKNTIQGRFFTALGNQTNSFPAIGGGNLAGAPVVTDSTYVVASISDDYTISPTLFNQFRFGYVRTAALPTNHSPFTYSGIGVTSSAQNNSLPNIGIAGSDTFGAGAYTPFIQNTFDVGDSLSWVHGRHNLRFGGSLARSQQFNPHETYYGAVGFAGWPDFLLGMSGEQNGTAGIPGFPPNGFSNVLYSFDLLGILADATRVWEASAYVQDDFKVNPRFTLNLGVRYEWLPPFTALHGRATSVNLSLVDPNPPPTGSLAGYVVPSNFTESIPAGVIKSSINSFVPGSGNNTFGPRLGFAYRVLPQNDRLVLRGGYGIYYSMIVGNSQFQSVPGLPWADLRVYTPPFNGASAFQNPFAEPIPPLSAFPFFEPYMLGTDVNAVATQENIRPGITQEYTMNLQTQLSPNLALQVAYVGSKADHLIYSRSINAAGWASSTNEIRGQDTNTVANIALRVPYLGFDASEFLEEGSRGRSNYNALEVTLKRNFSKGLQFLASYTFSKTLSTGAPTINGSTYGGGTVGDPRNLYSAYGPANFSRPQRLIVSSTYEFPKFNQGPHYARTLLNGWALTGVLTLQSGTPLSIVNTNATNVFGITGANADFAYYDPTLSGCNGKIKRGGSVNSRLTEYFNTACFTTPPVIGDDGIGTGFGNTGAGILLGPDQRNVDLSLSKITPLGSERVKLEFRAEFFNVFNTTQFANPDTALSDGPAFGRITSTSVAPRIGQLALKLQF